MLQALERIFIWEYPYDPLFFRISSFSLSSAFVVLILLRCEEGKWKTARQSIISSSPLLLFFRLLFSPLLYDLPKASLELQSISGESNIHLRSVPISFFSPFEARDKRLRMKCASRSLKACPLQSISRLHALFLHGCQKLKAPHPKRPLLFKSRNNSDQVTSFSVSAILTSRTSL